MNDKKYTSVSELLKKFIDNNSEKKSFNDTWFQIIGENLYSRCSLVDIKNETLIIEVTHPAVAQNIMFDKPKILKKINLKYPELHVKKIRTVLKKQYHYKKTPAPQKNERKKISEKLEINPNLPENLKTIFIKIKSQKENSK